MQHQNNRVTALSPPLRRNSRLQFGGGALPTRRFLANIWCGLTIDGSIFSRENSTTRSPLHPLSSTARSLKLAISGNSGKPPASKPLIVGSPHSQILGEAASLSELA
jgi:hypothetical protein